MVDVSLEAVIGVAIAAASLIIATMHRWKNDICKDLKELQETVTEHIGWSVEQATELQRSLGRLEGQDSTRERGRGAV